MKLLGSNSQRLEKSAKWSGGRLAIVLSGSFRLLTLVSTSISSSLCSAEGWFVMKSD